MLKSILIRMRNIKGRSFVTLMIIIAVSSLVFRFGIEGIIEINISQNESVAQETVKLISAALENYARDNHGIYPTSLSILVHTKPPYLDQNYIAKSAVKGYSYSCGRLESSGYNCSAIPTKCNLTGRTNYAVSTGGSLALEECAKKE